MENSSMFNMLWQKDKFWYVNLAFLIYEKIHDVTCSLVILLVNIYSWPLQKDQYFTFSICIKLIKCSYMWGYTSIQVIRKCEHKTLPFLSPCPHPFPPPALTPLLLGLVLLHVELLLLGIAFTVVIM